MSSGRTTTTNDSRLLWLEEWGPARGTWLFYRFVSATLEMEDRLERSDYG